MTAAALLAVLNGVSVVLVLVWNVHFRPLGLSSPDLFQWHPILMTLAMGVLVPQGVTAFRWRAWNRPVRKTVHGTLGLCALLLAVVGVAAVIQFHVDKNIPNFYSLHSWLGVLALGGVVAQASAGSFVFFSKAGMALRSRFHRTHILLGQALVVLSTMALTTGIMEKNAFTQTCTPMSNECRVANALGVNLVATALCALYIVQQQQQQLASGAAVAAAGDQSSDPLEATALIMTVSA